MDFSELLYIQLLLHFTDYCSEIRVRSLKNRRRHKQQIFDGRVFAENYFPRAEGSPKKSFPRAMCSLKYISRELSVR